jgi:hypothetical protein
MHFMRQTRTHLLVAAVLARRKNFHSRVVVGNWLL